MPGFTFFTFKLVLSEDFSKDKSIGSWYYKNMIIKDIEFKLKDGRTAILRSANEKDAKALIEYMKKSTGETDFLLRTPEECETQTIEQEIDFINNCN